MKILVVCQYYYPEPFRITDICETLVQNGHNITILTGLPNYPEGHIHDDYRFGKKRNETINGVKVIRCLEIGRGKNNLKLFCNYLSFALFASLKALFLKDDFDIVLANQLSPITMVIPALLYKRIHHKKMLLYCLDLWPDSLASGGVNEGSLIYKLVLKMSKWIYNTADKILVTSNMFKEYFRDTLALKNKDIEYLPQYAEDLYSRKVDVPKSDKFNFVFAGNVGDMQSIQTIISAANVLKSNINILFHIVGDGSKLNECKQLANELILNNIIFYGRRPVSEMPNFYGIADAMLITLQDNKSLSYTLPGKVQSYMAAGKPIIGSINGETNRIITESGCGLCCRAEDYEGLAKLIVDFCNSDQKDIMGANARKYYIENYSKERFMAGIEKALAEMEA